MNNMEEKTENRKETKPIDYNELDSLLNFHLTSVSACSSAVPLSKCRAKNDGPKLLVCHDMAGGYLNDRFNDGCIIDNDQEPPFHVTHWPYIDTFVYFSHHFVTIPPVGWIDAAHTNGVAVLGTFITEHDEGSNVMNTLLSGEHKLEAAAKGLAMIAYKHNFEGWLVNIENPIKILQVPRLFKFITTLRNECKRLIGTHAEIVWYDSVIVSSGRLRWQDELNALNKPFFDLCDAIFLNYTWNEAALQASATAAGPQNLNRVYVGIDCFGRGVYGGGGYNCDLAVGCINKYGLSVALFAPGWVHEHDKKLLPDFVHNNHKFWSLILANWRCIPYECQLPCKFTFHNGSNMIGHDFDKHLFNMRKQDRQPHLCCSGMNSRTSIMSIWKTGLFMRQSMTQPVNEDFIRFLCINVVNDSNVPFDVLLEIRATVVSPPNGTTELKTAIWLDDDVPRTIGLTARPGSLPGELKSASPCTIDAGRSLKGVGVYLKTSKTTTDKASDVIVTDDCVRLSIGELKISK